MASESNPLVPIPSEEMVAISTSYSVQDLEVSHQVTANKPINDLFSRLGTNRVARKSILATLSFDAEFNSLVRTPSQLQLPQQGQHALWQLVSLGHHRSARLLQNLRTRQVGGFHCKVSVLNPRAGSRQVLCHVGQIVDRRTKPILNSTQIGARGID